jgi:hypothetical protein
MSTAAQGWGRQRGMYREVPGFCAASAWVLPDLAAKPRPDPVRHDPPGRHLRNQVMRVRSAKLSLFQHFEHVPAVDGARVRGGVSPPP